MTELKYWLWLHTRKNVTPIKISQLIQQFSDPAYIYSIEDYSKIDGIKLDAKALLSLHDKSFNEVDRIIEYCARNGIEIISCRDIRYPEMLKNIYHPPLVLFVRGDISFINDSLMISFVGTRKCSAYGISVTDKIAGEVAKHGVVIVSGMARGIDTAAHEAAIRAGAKTIAVLGCGVDVCYPRENKYLMEKIIANGAVISEFIPKTPPDGKNFPQRNRIISGLANGVVIPEAPARSGALITASYAADQGKDVFAIPGDITNPCCYGTNKLIADGAKLVMSAEDILVEYGISSELSEEKNSCEENCIVENSAIEGLIEGYSEKEKKILRAIGTEEKHIDSIISQSSLSGAEVLSYLTMLEISGAVEQKPGKFFKLII